MKILREALTALRGRCSEAKTDAEALADVAFGARKLVEAAASIPELPDGRRGMLEDLRRKASQAESTHDPLIIADLITALTAFLGEEMAEPEAGNPDESGADTSTTPDELPTDSSAADTQESEASTYACEACGHPNKLPEQNSPRGAQKGAETMAEKDNAPDLAAQLEAERTKNAELTAEVTRMREAAPPADKPELTEQERLELQELRTEKRARLMEAERLSKATAAIEAAAKESGVPNEILCEILPPAELGSFQESQWPTMLNFALRNAPTGQVGFAGTGEVAMPAPGRSKQTIKREAGSLFRQRFGGSAKPQEA